MKPRDYKRLIKTCYEAKVPLIALGPPGIGKTAIVYEVANELNIDVYYLPFSSLADRTDFRIGIPSGNLMKFVYSEELPTNNKAGILLLDDITDADKYLLSCAKSLLFERKLSKYIIPESVSVVATGNPLHLGGLSHISEKEKTRVIIVNVDVDVDDWLEWARKKRISEMIRAFIRYKPDALYYNEDTIIAPRNWEIIDKLIKSIKIPEELYLLAEPLGGLYAIFKTFVVSFENARNNLDLIKKILNGEQYSLPNEMQEVFNLLNAIVWYVSTIKIDKKQALNLLSITRQHSIPHEYRIYYLKELLLVKENLIQLPEYQKAIKYLEGGEE